MAGTDFLIQVVLPSISGITTDQAIYDFAFHPADPGTTDIYTPLTGFFNSVHSPGTSNVAHWLATSRSRATNACQFVVYDISDHLNGSDHGPPVDIHYWTLSAGGAGVPDLPSEVAVCCSISADLTGISEFSGDTRPRARRRGRIYLGPLGANAADESTSGSVRPHPDMMQDIAGSAEALAGEDAGWSVWSRVDAVLRPVTNGWVDNAFDTIRGRGIDPTLKVSWVLP